MFASKNPWNLKSTMKMHQECPVCKQPMNIEVGFYYGSSYVELCILHCYQCSYFRGLVGADRLFCI